MAGIKERRIRLVHELMYQIKVEEVMTREVVTFPPTATLREIQLCMKKRRFSGVPITEKGFLMGMVSIDDIITALDRGVIDEAVDRHMTRDVVTVPREYSVIAASNLFTKYGFGRLPVVDHPGSARLVGIVTYGDILSHLLLTMNTIAERVEEQEKKLYNHVTGPRDTLHFELEADNFDLAGMASTAIKKRLKESGVPAPLVRRIAVICYEAEINVIIHSLGGFMDVTILDDRVDIKIHDEGPGIPDLEKALTAGFTTANEKIRALGFGAGMGLVNIKRCADRFDIRSSMNVGTELNVTVYLDPEARRREMGSEEE